MKEIKFLLPKPALSLREIKPAQWVNLGECVCVCFTSSLADDQITVICGEIKTFQLLKISIILFIHHNSAISLGLSGTAFTSPMQGTIFIGVISMAALWK
jgi:hypothetical protein